MRTVTGVVFLWTAASVASAQDLEFQRQLMKKSAVTIGDVCMIWHGLEFEPDPHVTAERACARLVEKGIVPEEWKSQLQAPASLGDVCVLICRSLDIKGGVTMRVVGTTARYAYKECARLRLVKAAGPHARVPGRDLLSISSRMEEWLEVRRKK